MIIFLKEEARRASDMTERAIAVAEKLAQEKKSEDFFTVVRETDDGYVVRITKTDEKTGEENVRKEFISREAFEAGIRDGYLKKVVK